MKTRVSRALLWSSGLFLICGVLLPVVSPRISLVVWHLPQGWIGFLKRVVPHLKVNWSGLGMGMVCSVLIVAGIHYMMSWLYGFHSSGAAKNWSNLWRPSWSCAFYGALWLLFLAAMGITGVAHQVGWLMTSKVPLRVVREFRGDYIRHLKYVATEIAMVGEDNGWALEETRKAFYRTRSLYPVGGLRPNAIEDLHVLFLDGQKGKSAAAVACYRDPVKREKSGFVLVPLNNREAYELKELKELPSVLARYQPSVPVIEADSPRTSREQPR